MRLTYSVSGMRRGTTFVILLQPHKKGQEIYFSGEKKKCTVMKNNNNKRVIDLSVMKHDVASMCNTITANSSS